MQSQQTDDLPSGTENGVRSRKMAFCKPKFAVYGADISSTEENQPTRHSSEHEQSSSELNTPNSSLNSQGKAPNSEQHSTRFEYNEPLNFDRKVTGTELNLALSSPSSERQALAFEHNTLSSERNTTSSEQNAPSLEYNAPKSDKEAQRSELNALNSEHNVPNSERDKLSFEGNLLNSECSSTRSEQNAPSFDSSASIYRHKSEYNSDDALNSEYNPTSSEPDSLSSDNDAPSVDQNTLSFEFDASKFDLNSSNSEQYLSYTEPLAPNSGQLSLNPKPLAISSRPPALSSEPLALSSRPPALNTKPLAHNSEPFEHSSEQFTPRSEQFALSSGQLVLSSGQLSLSPEHLALSSELLALSFKPLAPSSEPLVLDSEQYALNSEPLAPNSGQFALSSETLAQSCEQLNPETIALTSKPLELNTKTLAPNSEPLALGYQQFAPNSRQLSFSSEPLALSSEHLALSSEPLALSSKPLAPNSEQPALSSEPLALSSEPFALSSKSLTPNSSEPLALISEQFAPNSRQLAHSSGQLALNSEPLTLSSKQLALSSEPLALSSEALALTFEPLTLSSKQVVLSTKPLAPNSEQFALNTEPLAPNSGQLSPISEVNSTSSASNHEQIAPWCGHSGPSSSGPSARSSERTGQQASGQSKQEPHGEIFAHFVVGYDGKPCEFTLGDSSEPDEEPKPTESNRGALLASFVACLDAAALGTVIGYASPAIPDINDHPNSFHLTTFQLSWAASLIALGEMLGGAIAGPILDRYGRKFVIIANTIPLIIGWLIIAACPMTSSPIDWLYVGRFLTGIAAGVIDVAVPVYLAEVSPASIRGFIGSCYELFVNLGILFAFTFGIFLRFNWLAIACAFVPTVMMILMCFMPETPRWLLAARNSREGAVQALVYIRGRSGKTDPSVVEPEIQDIMATIRASSGAVTWRDFFQPTVYKPLAIILVLMFVQQFSGYGVVYEYSVKVFADCGSDGITSISPYDQAAIVGVAGVVSNLITAALVDRSGRRPMLIISAIIMAVGMGCLGGYFMIRYTDQNMAATSAYWLPLLSMSCYNFGLNIGFAPIPFYMASELFPLRTRGVMCGISITIWSLYFFIVSRYFMTDLLEIINHFGVFWILTCVSILAIFFVIYCVPETKGKTLEEIEAEFRK